MDTQESTAGGAWMARDEWLRQYDDELRLLGSHPTKKVVLTVAHAFHGEEDPRAAAREYHHQTESGAETPDSIKQPPGWLIAVLFRARGPGPARGGLCSGLLF